MTVQVFLLDQFTQIAELTTFTRVEIVEKDLAVGTFRVVFDPTQTPAVLDAALNATWLGVEIYDSDTGYRWMGTVQQDRRLFRGQRTPELYELRGVDLMDHLDTGLDWPHWDFYNQFWLEGTQTGQLSVVVSNSMYFQRGIGSTVLNRRIPGLLVVDPPTPFGPVKSELRARRSLLDTWAGWFRGTPYTMRMRFERTGTAGDGQIRFEPVERATTEIVVSPEFHPGQIEVVRTAAAATHVISMGEPTGGANPLERFTGQAVGPESNWLEAHREKFINRPSADQAVCDNEVDDAVIANGPKLAIRASDIDIPTYGSDARIGDYVTVSFSTDEGPYLLPIAEMKLAATTSEQFTWTATIGAELPGPAQTLSDRISRVAAHVNRVEGDV